MDSQNPESPARDVPVQTESDNDLEKRLINWKDERPITRYGERNARGSIVGAMIRDLQRDRDGKPWSSDQVIASLTKRAKDLNTGDEKSIDSKDSVTKEPFTTKISKTEGGWLAEEIRPDGSIISQARISNSGQTELTLHFSGKRYEDRKANPNITSDRRFPEATVNVVNLLAGVVNK